MSHWLIYTCGIPFSGKSTLSIAVARSTGFEIVSVDAQFAAAEVETWRDAYLAAYRALDLALAEGRSVLFDSVGHTRKHRDRLRRRAERFGAEALAIWLKVSVDEANRRRIENQVAPIRPQVPDDGFAEIISGFEPLQPDEAHITYRPGQTLTEWTDRVLAPVIDGQD
jgi:predicted kinase